MTSRRRASALFDEVVAVGGPTCSGGYFSIIALRCDSLLCVSFEGGS